MLNFHQLVLRKFLLIFSLLFIALGIVVYYWVKEFQIEQTKNALIDNIKVLSLNLPRCENLDKLAQDIKNDLGLRLTLIDFDGNIIAESHKDKTKMGNHKYRDEVVASNDKEYAYKIRRSNTLKKDFLYVVKRYESFKTPMYIRLSLEIKGIEQDILSLGEEILVLLLLFFIVLFFVTYKISKRIEEEVQKIVNFLTSLTKKDKETYISSNFSLEFHKITSLLTKVSQILVKKEKQKSKFTQKLQISNKQKDDIISAISHEFKNPIAVINGYSQTLMDDKDINPNIRQKFLTKIYKNGIKLSELIDTLRLSSKLDSGQQEMQFKTINIYELVTETVENIQLNYPKRQVIVNGDKDITLKGDSSLFSVVITNLVENAFKYSEDEVIIEFDAQKISVIDTGIGISKKNLENITNKFYRVNENSWNNSLGLGLFIVNNILNLHNFKLEVQSIENEGSTFSVKF
ncbi:sensor histidine kinase [Sulfurimonas aquatica]|uniref:histidine kinase n=1 Tax=Sulfurimonas aquatica TaxID=2672570 RepID=A0A975B1X2_9BACT|nr:HAMP domain-containing sensor histidine kinase [Sulfurimonas aquatica]QSZ42731.1 sensor histidine kinase [Sulfurimonas aquatica]